MSSIFSMGSWLESSWWAVGPLSGFATFLVGTATMDGIYSRPDEQNKQVFSLNGLWEYIKAPFQVGTPAFYTVWSLIPGIKWTARLKMLQLNWVVMVGIGTLASYALLLLL